MSVYIITPRGTLKISGDLKAGPGAVKDSWVLGNDSVVIAIVHPAPDTVMYFGEEPPEFRPPNQIDKTDD
jgi:hypothetical protein